MAGAGGIMSGVASLNDSFNGNPPASVGMSSGQMNAPNSAQGAMDMQKTNTMADAASRPPLFGPGGQEFVDERLGLKDYLKPSQETTAIAMDQPPQIAQSPAMDLADQTINSTPPADDGLLGNPRTQKTINNANAAIGLGSTINGMFQGNPPPPGGFPARSFQMPNSVLGMRSVFGR